MLRLIILISCYLGLTLCLFDEINSRPHYVSSIYEYFVNMSHGRHRNLRSNIIQQNNRFNDPKDSVNFVFFGDWGYLGENQTLVASSMSQWTQDNGGKFVIALGDNFYVNGVSSDTDPLWKSVYEDVYNSAPLKSIPWYAVLGNHDYRENPEAQIDYYKNKRDNRWTMPDHDFRVIYPIPNSDNKTIEIIFIDSLFIAPSEAHETDSGGKYEVSSQMTANHLKIIERYLAASNSTWLFVAGHYPVFSMAEHGDTRDMIRRLEPLLRKYSVTAYMNGHDHVLQHISWHGVEYITSGHGTLTDNYPEGYFPYTRNPDPKISVASEGYKFGTIGPGFGAIQAGENILIFEFFDRNGKQLYSTMFTNPRNAGATTVADDDSNSSDGGLFHFTHHPFWIKFLIFFIASLILVSVIFIVYLINHKREAIERTVSLWARGCLSCTTQLYQRWFHPEEVGSSANNLPEADLPAADQHHEEIEITNSQRESLVSKSSRSFRDHPSLKNLNVSMRLPKQPSHKGVDSIKVGSDRRTVNASYSMVNQDNDYDEFVRL